MQAESGGLVLTQTTSEGFMRLRYSAVLPEPSFLVHTKSESRRRIMPILLDILPNWIAVHEHLKFEFTNILPSVPVSHGMTFAWVVTICPISIIEI